MKRSTDCLSIANRPQADHERAGETMEMAQGWYRARGDSGTPQHTLCAAHGEGLMSIAIIRKALLWCAVINYGVLDYIADGFMCRSSSLILCTMRGWHCARLVFSCSTLSPQLPCTLLEELTPTDPIIPEAEQHKWCPTCPCCREHSVILTSHR